jgi:hypothetical protein
VRLLISSAKRNNLLDQFGRKAPVSGLLGNLSYYWGGGHEDGVSYDRSGYPYGYAPITGSPDFLGGLNTISKTPSILKHIFRNVPNHVNPSTITSQERYIKLFESIANNPKNINSGVLNNFQKLESSFQGFSRNFKNGQVWVQVRNGKIFDAGVNKIPR